VDNRGDVGSVVRQAAMEAGEQLCQLMSQGAFARISTEFMHGYFGALTGQAAEKIDRVREQAGTTIVRLLQSKQPLILGIPQREILEQVPVLIGACCPIRHGYPWCPISPTCPTRHGIPS
jgi:hypothetical protein